MIILDIDQDYFFLPALSGKLITDRNERNKVFYPAPTQPIDIINKFNLYNFKNYYNIFEDHDGVYYDYKKYAIKNKVLSKPKLVHLDAHDDVTHMDKLGKVNIGNWITHLIKEDLIDNNIIWINQMTSKPHVVQYNIEGKFYYLHTSKIDDFSFNNKIDILYYTRSPLFCPDNYCESFFFKTIIKQY